MLELMGLKEGEVGEHDSLAQLGLDSLQLVEIRSKVQTAVGRPLPLEQVRDATKIFLKRKFSKSSLIAWLMSVMTTTI